VEHYSPREVIEQAIQTERLGHDFYRSMSQKFNEHDKLKSLFETLAAKELQHEKKFSELKKCIKESEPEEWKEVSPYLRAIVESEFFLGKNKSLPSIQHLSKMEDALSYALGFERETLLYYIGLKDIVEGKDVINEIINEEKSHIVWLNELKTELKL
jgi:rubrerythrin